MACSIEFSPVKSEYESVRVCRGCLATDGRMFDIHERRLEQSFSELTGLTVAEGLLCCVCLQLLRKFKEFRSRCVDSFHILQQLQPVSQDILDEIDRTHLKQNLVRSTTILLNCEYPNKNQKTNETNTAGNTDPLDLNESSKHPQLSISDCESDVYDNDLNDEIEDTDSRDVSLRNENAMPNLDNALEVVDIENKIENSEVSQFFSADCNSNESCKENGLEIDKETTNGDKEKETNKKSLKIINEINKVFHTIRIKINNQNGDFCKLFEMLYKLSTMNEPPASLAPSKKVNAKKKSVLENMMCLIYLYRQLAELHNISIEFRSISSERRAMDARRLTATGQQCPQCCRVYRSPATLQRHINLSHQENLPYQCVVCQYKFKKQLRYLMHVFKVHTMRKTCNECGQHIVAFNYYNHWEEVENHIDSAHRKPRFLCEYCGRGFTLMKLRYSHIRLRHPTQMAAAQCLLCGDCFNGPNGLRNHLVKIHRGAAPCAACGVWFVDAPARAAHAARGECRGESGCPLCGVTFPTEQLMKEHYDDIHAKYKCEKCNITFVELQFYKEHRSRVCEKRPRRSPDRSADRSLRRSPNRSPLSDAYICDVCGKQFRSAAALRLHARAHGPREAHECALCHKRFRRALGRKGLCFCCLRLENDAGSHSVQTGFKCGLCAKTFRNSYYVRRHVLAMHTDGKRFACEHCGKRYAFKSSLVEHIRTIHEGLPHQPRNRQRNRAIRKPTRTSVH